MRLANDFVACRIPATSANLGLGFDSMGLAPDLWDGVSVHTTVGPTVVVVEGEGAGQVDEGEKNLIVRTLRLSLDRLGAPQVGIRIHCHSRIPHSRGLGSSVAAIVAGLVLVRALIGEEKVSDPKDVLDIDAELEGHPDSIAPAIFGGAIIAWMEGSTAGALRLTSPVQILPVVFIPDFEPATEKARSALPELIAYEDARYNISRAALLSVPLSGAYEAPAGATLHRLLMDATGDRFHQGQRRATMESSLALADWLRAGGMLAVVSGVGPTVLSLEKVSASLRHDAEGAGWRVLSLPVAPQGAQITRRRLAGLCGMRARICALFAFAPPSSCDLFRKEVQILAQYSETGRALLHSGRRFPWTDRFTALTHWRFPRRTFPSEVFYWGRFNEP